ncbi:ATP-binding cassette domain-containing protein [Erwinia tracheiphila]|uniref:ATP-binding cassette domain-containing protein n=1 Tax=Erwinia tracheiphila TaxID=65700 RepID=UPI00039A5675|nr:ATP-binding cassette domain-containing protein [Erwinia tracheiphila]UIA86747.1 ATP-binding cassette domain-containing protein [Erwinia tracheiphila]UIA95103.1 ATP-binding cassette domain-containing protein [Erwinia tracheiphila]
MSTLHISQSLFYLNEYRNLTLGDITLNVGESRAFVGANGSGKFSLARVLSGELNAIKGDVVNQFSRPVRLSPEQLQALVADEWQRNNTDMPGVDEDDTGLTTQQIIEERIKIRLSASVCPGSLASTTCWRVVSNISLPGKPVKPCCVRH